MRNQQDTDDMIKSINQSLARQVQEEMSGSAKGSSRRKKKGGMSKIIKAIFLLLLIIAAGASFLFLTKPGRAMLVHIATEYAYSKLDFAGNDDLEETILDENGKIITPNINPYKMSETYRGARHEKGVINILLLGVEAIGYGQSGGHTDSIMIATMNTNTGELKLTSLLRDSWVTIPGYGENRINTAYAKGGIETFYETIAYNYDLQIDGYALVGFDAFEQIVDTIEGIEIELTEEEAAYLNKTNYISNKAYRNVVPGKQLMNGNQVLGYCRVRKIPTLDGSNYDMGRTSRHRRTMNAIFEKIKTSSLTELVDIVNNVLPLVETDIRKSNCKAYLTNAVEIGLQDLNIQTLRLPEDGGFSSEKINGAAVLVPFWDETRAALADFVFGTEEEAESSVTDESASPEE